MLINLLEIFIAIYALIQIKNTWKENRSSAIVWALLAIAAIYFFLF